MAEREPAAALLVLNPILKRFAPFATTAGSWWPTIARLRLQVLQQGGVVATIEQAARELAALSTEPEAVGEAKLALTELEVRAGRARLAEAMLESILSSPVPAAVRARAWLLRGDIAMADKRYEAAVEAYLRIPVFHGAYDELVPAALLAGERAFLAWGDVAQAERLARDRARREAPVEMNSAPSTHRPPDFP
jgi:tetratricopeptide (TPR) repeat protein